MSTLTEWEQHPDNETVDEVAARFGLPREWAIMHVGQHTCLDGRTYIASCLVSDPDMDWVARRKIARRADQSGTLRLEALAFLATVALVSVPVSLVAVFVGRLVGSVVGVV